MMAFQATAEGGDRFAVVIDNVARVKKIASMRTIDRSQSRSRKASGANIEPLRVIPAKAGMTA
jgi:hypothetical protein